MCALSQSLVFHNLLSTLSHFGERIGIHINHQTQIRKLLSREVWTKCYEGLEEAVILCRWDRQEGGAWEPSGGGWTECWQAHVGAGQVTEGTRRRYRQGREGKSDAHRNQAFVQFSCPAGVYGEGAVKIRLVKSTGQCRNLEDVPFLNNLLQDGLQERNITIIVRKEIKTNR